MTHADGTVIQAEFARKTGISQSTLSRLLAGDPEWQLTRDSQLKLMETFGITQAEASGMRPISKATIKTKVTPTARELELIRELRNLPGNDRKDIETLINLKSALRDQ